MNILFVIESDFWNKTKGISTRFNEVFEQYKDFDRSILFIGKIKKDEKNKIVKEYTYKFYSFFPLKRKIYAVIRVAFNKLHIKIPKFMYNPINQSKLSRRKVEKIINENKIDVVWMYYLWNYNLLSFNSNYFTIVDTQDVTSDIVNNKKKMNLFYPSLLTFNDEIKILDKFDLVLAISKRDFNCYSTLNSKLYYLPFYFETKNLFKKDNDEISLGFIGGTADFNIIAAKRIINEILPKCHSKFKFYFFGKICDLIKDDIKNDNVILYGLVDDVSEAYNLIDIAINPASIGSGLKTKCVEAMAYGIPLITTSIGAQGMEDAVNNVFLVSDDNNIFAQNIDFLVDNNEKRNELSNLGIKYINDNFGIDKYKNLKKLIIERVKKNGKES